MIIYPRTIKRLYHSLQILLKVKPKFDQLIDCIHFLLPCGASIPGGIDVMS